MLLCGLQKLSMVDFPAKLAATVFTGGCNLRCPFCHNALLVTRLEETEALTESEVLDFLSSRKNLLDGVVLTGGEPLLHADAIDFLQKVRDLGFAIKLDTNGFFPERLSQILSAGLADYVAMDIKASPQGYAAACGMDSLDLTPVRESIQLLQHADVEFEFRTTAVRELHSQEDFLSIGEWLQGSPQYFIQNFVDSGNLIHQGFHSFEVEELQGFAALLTPFFDRVELRGV